jgi:hypothetical protein
MKYLGVLTIYSLMLLIGLLFCLRSFSTQRQSASPDVYYCAFSASGTEEVCGPFGNRWFNSPQVCHREPVKTYNCFNPSLDEHCSVTEFLSGGIRTTCAYVQWPKDKPK